MSSGTGVGPGTVTRVVAVRAGSSPVYGTVAYINVGAHMVGTIKYTGIGGGPDTDEIQEGTQVAKGQDLGYFKFGGSTVVCLWEPGASAGRSASAWLRGAV